MNKRIGLNASFRVTSAFAAALLLGLPSLVSAQSTNATFKDLSKQLKVNDRVRVIDSQGRHVDGLVAELTPDSVTVDVQSSKDPNTLGPAKFTPTVFKDANTRQITVFDSKANGLKIGFGIGLAAGLISGIYGCPASECVGDIIFGAAVFGGVGALVGMGIDGAHNKTVYKAGAPKKTIALAPVVGAGRRGLIVSMRF